MRKIGKALVSERVYEREMERGREKEECAWICERMPMREKEQKGFGVRECL